MFAFEVGLVAPGGSGGVVALSKKACPKMESSFVVVDPWADDVAEVFEEVGQGSLDKMVRYG
jgi:hypothetical protein